MRRARQTRFPALLAVAALALLAPTGGAQSTARCSGAQLSGKVRLSSGAAGTAAVSIAVRNVSDHTCTLRGFPRLKLHNGSGPLPTLVRAGGLAILNEPVTTVTLPGREGEPARHLFDGAHGGRDLVRPRDEPRDLPRQRAREAHDPVLPRRRAITAGCTSRHSSPGCIPCEPGRYAPAPAGSSPSASAARASSSGLSAVCPASRSSTVSTEKSSGSGSGASGATTALARSDSSALPGVGCAVGSNRAAK